MAGKELQMKVAITFKDLEKFLCTVCSDGVGWHFANGTRRCLRCLERSGISGAGVTEAPVPRWAERAIAELFAWGDGAEDDESGIETSFVCAEHMDSLLRGVGGKKD